MHNPNCNRSLLHFNPFLHPFVCSYLSCRSIVYLFHLRLSTPPESLHHLPTLTDHSLMKAKEKEKVEADDTAAHRYRKR